MLPIIEYASSVWSPYTSLPIIAKWKVFSANLLSVFLAVAILSYPDRLVRLNLNSLVVRRLRHDLILTYKIIFGLTDMNLGDFLTFANSNHSTRGHAYKLLPSHCRVNVRKSFFGIVKPRNCLPAELHHFSSLSVFKSFVFSTDLSDFVMC